MAESWQETLLPEVSFTELAEMIFNLKMDIEGIRSILRQQAIKQAKATWEARGPEIEVARQAGMNEVVEWIDSHRQIEKCDQDTMPYFSDYWWIVEADWKAFLKENGLEVWNIGRTILAGWKAGLPIRILSAPKKEGFGAK